MIERLRQQRRGQLPTFFQAFFPALFPLYYHCVFKFSFGH
jgi:hypothetical protein